MSSQNNIDAASAAAYSLGVSSTTENYLKRILTESENTDSKLVSLGTLAASLGVTPGTVTTMMKGLAEAGLVSYRPRQGVALTAPGRNQALQVLRRHRLIELFLVEVLNLDWAEVHEEAEVLEHSVSDRLLDRIDEVLGHPTVDPHGDPIPDRRGELPEPTGVPLDSIKPPATLQVVRVEHEDAGFLDYVKETGLTPGAQLYVVDRSQAAGTVTIRVADRESAISLESARRILCTGTS